VKAVRRIARLVARTAGALVIAAIVVAFGYEHISAWRDRSVLTHVGRSIDVGGRSLNIHCAGEGSPTVVFESGRTSPGYIWMQSQRSVSQFTRACWHDRAGLGWSDPGPDPSWGDAAAVDLHTLLANAGVPPPYVMVGASFGGYVIRLFHHAYPGEVAGMVFADTALEDAGTIEGIPHRDPPPIPRAVIRALSLGLGQLGMMRFASAEPGPPPAGWSAHEWDVLARLRRQRASLLADAQEGPEKATADLVRHAGGLDEMPMIVLTQGRLPRDPASVGARVQRGWIELQRQFAGRSRKGRQIVVAESGHGIPLEAPGTVTAAVRDIVDTVRDARR
jgi:pimeloyl-ACP methyl ester carboxylesterase